MVRVYQHMRFIELNNKQLLSACYWYVPATINFGSIGIDQNSTEARPWFPRT